MELLKFSLSFAKQLSKTASNPYKVSEYIDANTIVLLQELMKKINAHSSCLITYSFDGNHVDKKILIGKADDWLNIDHTKIQNNIAIYRQKYLFKIFCPTESTNIGVLGISRSKKFSYEEREIIDLILTSLGSHCESRLLNTIKHKINRKLVRISKHSTFQKRPGTVISNLIQTYHNIFNIKHSYFCLIDEGKITIDYFKHKKGYSTNMVESHSWKPLDNKILNLAKKHDFFEWKDSKQFFEIKKIISGVDNRVLPGNELRYFISPIKNDNEIIAMWIFAFSPFQIAFSEDLKEMINLINQDIYKKYFYLYQRRTQKMIVDPIFKSRDTKVDPNKIFVLMPFTLGWSDRIWLRIIKPTVESLDFQIIRADDLFGADLMEDIWEGILTSRIVIADITNRNANVFYELGLAHAIGKDVILITQNVDDIPFDLNRFRHIDYEDNADGYDILKNKLENTIKDILK